LREEGCVHIGTVVGRVPLKGKRDGRNGNLSNAAEYRERAEKSQRDKEGIG